MGETKNQKLLFSEAMQVQLSSLDGLDLAFLLVDQNLNPRYISHSGAQILQIKRRDELRDYFPLFPELINTAKTLRGSISHAGLSSRHRNRNQELVLTTADSRQIGVIAEAKPIRLVSNGSGEVEPAFMVIFRELGQIAPLVELIEQYEQIRPLFILSSALLGGQISASKMQLSGENGTREDELLRTAIEQYVGDGSQKGTCDLARCVTTAVDVVDPLVPSSVKIVIDGRRSGLLSIKQVDCVRLLGHLLLDAADSCSPLGEVRLRTVVEIPKGTMQESGKHFAEVIITSDRLQEVSPAGDILDSYLARRLVRSASKTTVADDEPTIKQLTNGESTTGKGRALGNNSSVPPDLFSTNVRLADLIARNNKLVFQLRRPEPGKLLYYLRFPLSIEEQVQARR